MFLTSQQYVPVLQGLYEISFESFLQFLRKSKKSKNGCFLAIFEIILAIFFTSQLYEFNEIAHKGP